jgi:hypothetical protein
MQYTVKVPINANDRLWLLENGVYATEYSSRLCVLLGFAPRDLNPGDVIEAGDILKQQPPIDMVLLCPNCGKEHVDRPEPGTVWNNPPHAKHLCHFCGHLWKPYPYWTNGVASGCSK